MIWPFYLCAAIAIISSIRVITNTNPVHALLALISSLLAVAGIFFTIGAPFAAALEIIVYAGAILVLFVFVVMMLNLGNETVKQEKSWLTSSTWAFPCMSSALLLFTMVMLLNSQTDAQSIGREVVSAKQVGIALFGPYVLIVELASMLLLGALVAAYHLGKRKPTLDAGEEK